MRTYPGEEPGNVKKVKGGRAKWGTCWTCRGRLSLSPSPLVLDLLFTSAHSSLGMEPATRAFNSSHGVRLRPCRALCCQSEGEELIPVGTGFAMFELRKSCSSSSPESQILGEARSPLAELALEMPIPNDARNIFSSTTLERQCKYRTLKCVHGIMGSNIEFNC